jgi:heme/copper-type cytochrome/quinol oxidase subunit 3
LSDRTGNLGSPVGHPPGGGPQPIDAGGLAMIIFLASLSMLFGASILIYLLMRHMHQPWPPVGFPALPASLWASTLDIIVSSLAMQAAVVAARRDDQVGLRRNLVAALVLGLGFLGLQSYAWWDIWRQVAAVAGLSSAYLKMFYAMTGLHAAHVVGGLVPLVMVTVAAYQGMYGRRKNSAVRYTAIYWHFLDAVWCVLFVVVYLM